LASHAAFERNLSRIRRRHAGLARALESAGAEDDVRVVDGPRGGRTVSAGGMLLGSAYDPRGEGERLAEKMASEGADLLVAVGFGLGHHLEAFRQRNPCPILVYEPSAARLRAALSTRPIPLLERDDVFVTTELGLLGGMLARRYTPGLCVRVVPHPSALRLAPEAVREAVAHVQNTKNTLDITARTRVKMAAAWAGMTADNLPALLRSPSFGALSGCFRGLPAVVCAAGPSLDRQLPTLRRYADRVVILAIGQVVGALRRAGIEPDLVHVVESQDVSHQLTHAGDTRDLDLVLLPSCHPNLFQLPVRSRFTAYIAANQVGQWIAKAWDEGRWLSSGGTVAQTAVFLAEALGADPVCLIGQDLAFSQGRAYARGSVYDGVGFEDRGDGRYALTGIGRKMNHFGRSLREDGESLRQDLVWVPGWHGGRVPTSPAYAAFRESYRDIGSALKQHGVRLVNCTEGGARIPSLEHAPLAEVLEHHAGEPLPKRERLRAIHDAWTPPDRAVFVRRLTESRAALERLAREATRGRGEAERAPARLRAARSPQRTIDVLQGIARHEKRVRDRLGAVPWIDSFVQPRLHEARALASRADAAEATPQRAVEESLLLFETTEAGVEDALALLERIEAKLEEAYTEPAGGGPVRAEVDDAPTGPRALLRASSGRASSSVTRSSVRKSPPSAS
jgi:hypothetical protein